MIFKEAINEIFNRVNIVDVVGEYVRLKRVGSYYMGCCPFHNENTPSFSVDENRKTYLCFACHKSGNVITFIQEKLGLSFGEAVRMLAKRINIDVDDEFNDAHSKELKDKREKLYALFKDAANEYYKVLWSEKGKIGLDYLKSRNLSKETIKKFGLGFAPKDYAFMYNIMKEKGYDDSILFESKLFRLYNDKPADTFYNRVMFPLVDIYKHVVGFQSRSLEAKPEIRKYVNSEDNLVFHKRSFFYFFNYAALSQKNYYILCEGDMDAITLHQSGYDNAIATMGTAFNEKQISLLKRKLKKVYLCQDTDSAGVQAIISSYRLLNKENIETYVIDLKPSKDVDELINKYGIEEFNKRVNNPIPTLLFIISTFKDKYNILDPYELNKYLNDIVSEISNINNVFIRDEYLKKISISEKLDYYSLKKMLDDKLNGNSIKATEDIKVISKENNESQFVPTKLDSNFINLIYLLPDKVKEISNVLKPEELVDDNYRFLYNCYLDGKEKGIIFSEINDKDEKFKKNIEYLLNENVNINEDKNDDIILSLNQIIKQIKIRYIKNTYDENNSIENKFKVKKLIDEVNNSKYI